MCCVQVEGLSLTLLEGCCELLLGLLGSLGEARRHLLIDLALSLFDPLVRLNELCPEPDVVGRGSGSLAEC